MAIFWDLYKQYSAGKNNPSEWSRSKKRSSIYKGWLRKHILDRHGPNSTYGNKSHFNADFDIRDGIDSTLKGDNFVVGPNTAGREGYIFEQTFTNPIGTNSKGKPLYTLKVVIDEAGNVITAFPKK